MEIYPLECKNKHESLISSMKQVHANDVYQKNEYLKQQAKVKKEKKASGRETLLGSLCINNHTAIGMNSGETTHIKTQSPKLNQQKRQELMQTQESTGIVGFHLGGDNGTQKLIGALPCEYGQFQNAKLAQELAESRTISLDHRQAEQQYIQDLTGKNTQEMMREEDDDDASNSPTRHTILSWNEGILSNNVVCSADELQIQKKQSTEKGNYVKAEIIGSLKTGYGFLPNFSQPNNQGSRMNRQKATESNFLHQQRDVSPLISIQGDKNNKKTIYEKRIFARSPETSNIRMMLLPLSSMQENNKDNRPISMVVHQNQYHPTQKKVLSKNSKNSASQSRTDQASHSTPKALNQHKYGPTEDDMEQKQRKQVIFTERVDPSTHNATTHNISQQDNSHSIISPQKTEFTPSKSRRLVNKGISRTDQNNTTGSRVESKNSKKDCVIDFKSKSLYERYNKMINKTNISQEEAKSIEAPIAAQELVSKLAYIEQQQQLEQHFQASDPTIQDTQRQQKSLLEHQNNFSNIISSPLDTTTIARKMNTYYRNGGRKKKQVSKSQSKTAITIIVFKDKQKNSARDSMKQHQNISGGMIMKTTPRGVPLRKVDGRLKSLRRVDQPMAGTIQPNIPVDDFLMHHATLEQNLQQNQRNETPDSIQQKKEIEERKLQQCDHQQQTNLSNVSPVATERLKASQFALVKPTEHKLNFLETASEGTNRMSATLIKLKQSKMSSLENTPQVISENVSQQMIKKGSRQALMEKEYRRSVEIQKKRLGTEVGIVKQDARNQNMSKSLESAGQISGLHDMLKPKGIQVYEMSKGTMSKNLTTTDQKQKSTVTGDDQTNQTQEKVQMSTFALLDHKNHMQKIETLELPGNENIVTESQSFVKTHESDELQLKQSQKEEYALTTMNDEHVNQNQDAALRSSHSERAVSMLKDRSISVSNNQQIDHKNRAQKDVKKEKKSQNKKRDVQEAANQDDSQHFSTGSSIKTSIDDETLMEMAKKGITAATPTERRKISSRDVKEQLKASAIATALPNDVKGPVGQSRQTPIETPDSQMNIQMHSTLSVQSKMAKVNQKSEQNDSQLASLNMANCSSNADDDQSKRFQSNEAISSRSVIYMQQSPNRKKQNNDPSIIQIKDGNVEIDDFSSKLTEINSSKITAGGSQQSKELNNQIAELQNRSAFISELDQSNRPLQIIAENEAQSQTDFAELLPLDNFNELNEAYDENLMIVSDDSKLRVIQNLDSFKVIGTMIQSDSAGLVSKQQNGNSMPQSQLFMPSAFIHKENCCVLNSPHDRARKFSYASISQNNATIHTELGMTGFSSPTAIQLNQFPGIGMVNIATNERENNPRVSDFERSQVRTQKLVRNDETEEQDKLAEAAGRGKRIICNNLNSYPTVMNLRAEEQVSSPKQHHLIEIQGLSLKAMNIKERNQIKRADTLRQIQQLSMIPELAKQNKDNLSKDFENQTQNLMKRQSTFGVDKSIGKSSGSEGSDKNQKRKYYILSVDNTEDVDVEELDPGNMNLRASYAKEKKNHNFATFTDQRNREMNSLMSQKTPDYQQKVEKPLVTSSQDGDFRNKKQHQLGFQATTSQNDKAFSRQEDLETVYMPSNIQFDREIISNNAHLISNRQRSPSTYMSGTAGENQLGGLTDNNFYTNPADPTETRDRAHSVKNQMILHRRFESQEPSNFKKQQQILMDTGLIEETNLINNEFLEPRPGRLSGKVRQNSHEPQTISGQRSKKQFASGTGEHQQNQIENSCISSNNDHDQLMIAKQQPKSLFSKQGERGRYGFRQKVNNVDKQDILLTTQSNFNQVDTNNNSNSSLTLYQKLNYPKGDIQIQVNKTRQQRQFQTVEQERRALDVTAKVARPKTQEGSARKQFQFRGNPIENIQFKNKKLLAYKRKEVAIEKAKKRIDDTNSLVVNQAITRMKFNPSNTINQSNLPKPSFFDKVSAKMSNVFSSDRTSTQVASKAGTYFISGHSTQNHQNFRQRTSQARTVAQKQFTTASGTNTLTLEEQQKMMSNLSIVPGVEFLQPKKRQSAVRLRSKNSVGGTGGNINKIRQNSSYFNSANMNSNEFTSPKSNTYTIQDAQTKSNLQQPCSPDQHQSGVFNQNQENQPEQQLLLDAFFTQRSRQRVGLKTAEGGQRRKNEFAPAQQSNSKIVQSNLSIDMNNKFKGFDRRQTHDNMLQRIRINALNEAIGATTDSQEIEMLDAGKPILAPTLNSGQHNLTARIRKPLQSMPLQTTVSSQRGRTLMSTNSDIACVRKSPSTQLASGLDGASLRPESLNELMRNISQNKGKKVIVPTQSQIRVNQVLRGSASAVGQLSPRSAKFQHSQSYGGASAGGAGPMLHTESRKRARLLKQGATFRRNQKLKLDEKTDIEMQVPARDKIEQLLAIGSGSFCHLDFAAPADSQR